MNNLNLEQISQLDDAGLYEFVARTFEEKNQEILTAEDINTPPSIKKHPLRQYLDDPGEIDLKQVADELKIGISTVRYLVNKGDLPICKGEKKLKTTWAALEKLKTQRSSQNKLTLSEAAKELNIAPATLKKYFPELQNGYFWNISLQQIENLKEKRKKKKENLIAIKDVADLLGLEPCKLKKKLKKYQIKTQFFNKSYITLEEFHKISEKQANKISNQMQRELEKAKWEESFFNLEEIDKNLSKKEVKEILDF